MFNNDEYTFDVSKNFPVTSKTILSELEFIALFHSLIKQKKSLFKQPRTSC